MSRSSDKSTVADGKSSCRRIASTFTARKPRQQEEARDSATAAIEEAAGDAGTEHELESGRGVVDAIDPANGHILDSVPTSSGAWAIEQVMSQAS